MVATIESLYKNQMIFGERSPANSTKIILIIYTHNWISN